MRPDSDSASTTRSRRRSEQCAQWCERFGFMCITGCEAIEIDNEDATIGRGQLHEAQATGVWIERSCFGVEADGRVLI